VVAPTSKQLPIDDSFGNLALKNFSESNLPETLPLLPLAPAWHYIGIALLGLILFYLVKKVIFYINNRYRRQALKQLNTIVKSSFDQQKKLRLLAELIKTTGFYIFPRETITTMSGQAWLELLNQQCGQQVFSEHSYQLLGTNLYQPANNNQCSQSQKQWQNLVNETTKWLIYHPYQGIQPIIKPFSWSMITTFNRGNKQDA
tara:strand:+ start:5066 stop:5671 length:606 start_codon:yes stop_codon:yes gene_type:complete